MTFHIYRMFSIAVPLLTCWNTSLGGSDIQIDRYTQQSYAPSSEQSDLLSVVVKVDFPASIASVGGAIDYLLAQSGYAQRNTDRIELERLFSMPLPRVHRSIGPIPLRTALEMIAGKPWQIVEDPLERTVTFELKEGYTTRFDEIQHSGNHSEDEGLIWKYGSNQDMVTPVSNESSPWQFDESLTLYQNIDSWATKAGWHLDWKSRHDYEISYPSEFTGTIKDAVAQALDFYRAAPVPLMAKFYDGNSVLVIEPLR